MLIWQVDSGGLFEGGRIRGGLIKKLYFRDGYLFERRVYWGGGVQFKDLQYVEITEDRRYVLGCNAREPVVSQTL